MFFTFKKYGNNLHQALFSLTFLKYYEDYPKRNLSWVNSIIKKKSRMKIKILGDEIIRAIDSFRPSCACKFVCYLFGIRDTNVGRKGNSYCLYLID